MDNNTYYQELLLNRYSDIALGSTILIIIGGVIGVLGNAAIIFFYFFRIKEKGERYFIPLLAVVDLLGCLTSPPYYIMDNLYLYNYPSTLACRVLSFLQICIPGISAHMLLVISIQRFILVCRPFGPKMTLLWKRISFGIVCIISFAYSFPLLMTAGVYKENINFIGQNVTTEVCKFAMNPSPSMSAYVTLLFVIMVVNICLTAGLYIPVLKRITVSLRFSATKYEVSRESTVDSHGESSQTTRTSEIENVNTDHDKTKESFQMNFVETHDNLSISPKKVRFESNEKTPHQKEITNTLSNKTQSPKTQEKKNMKSKTTSAQRRITIMFLVLIVAYVLSYTPALVITVLFYILEDFKFLTMSRAETAVWFYLTRLVFFNHIVNPLVYGYFDTKFRKQLCKLCQRRQKL